MIVRDRLSALSIACAIGCASTPPELVGARQAYKRASEGVAARVAPAEVDAARRSLEIAERQYGREGNTQRTRDVAYAARRAAQVAQVTADAIVAQQRHALALQGVELTKADIPLAFQALTGEPALREGEPVLDPPRPRDAPESEKTYRARPNWPLFGTGLAMLTGSYGASAMAAWGSDRKEDDRLYVPLAGPWLDLASRDCAARPCGSGEGVHELLLMGSGVLQGAGAALVVLGLVVPRSDQTLAGIGHVARDVRIAPRGQGFTVQGRF